MGLTEYLLLGVVIVVPLVIAGAVTLWSLEQVRYRPKKSRLQPRQATRGGDGTSPTGGSSSPPPSAPPSS